VKPKQVFDRILHLQYQLDTVPPEQTAEVFESLDEAIEELCSLAGLTPEEVHDAVAERYEAYLKSRRD
jgi:hypothetical protein